MTRAFALSLVAAAAAITLPTPVFAQDAEGPSESYNQVIVYGDDPCPKSSDAEITVCARLEEGERYRIPKILRDTSSPANISWPAKVRSFETVGNFGIQSCTPIGTGGELGCTQQLIDQAYAERRNSSDVQFSQQIAEERAKRLATIDADAAATQARVEQIEREYMARIEREQAAAEAAAKVDDQPLPAPETDQAPH